jgi:hypothetical protein
MVNSNFQNTQAPNMPAGQGRTIVVQPYTREVWKKFNRPLTRRAPRPFDLMRRSNERTVFID